MTFLVMFLKFVYIYFFLIILLQQIKSQWFFECDTNHCSFQIYHWLPCSIPLSLHYLVKICFEKLRSAQRLLAFYAILSMHLLSFYFNLFGECMFFVKSPNPGHPQPLRSIFKTAWPLLQICPSFRSCPATELQNLTILFGRQQLSPFKDQVLGRTTSAYPVTKWDGLAFTVFPGCVTTANFVIWIFVVF